MGEWWVVGHSGNKTILTFDYDLGFGNYNGIYVKTNLLDYCIIGKIGVTSWHRGFILRNLEDQDTGRSRYWKSICWCSSTGRELPAITTPC